MAQKKAAKTAKKAAKKTVRLAKNPAKSGTKKPAKTLAARSTKPTESAQAGMVASQLITAHIQKLGDWRGERLALVRKLIHEAEPAIVEEWKWDIPVWSHDGIVTTGETYKEYVKLTFAKGAFLADPHRVFNTGFAGNVRRAIDIRIDSNLDAAAFRELVREAIAFNQGHLPKSRRASGKS